MPESLCAPASRCLQSTRPQGCPPPPRDAGTGCFLSCAGEKLRLREATEFAKVTHLAWKEQGCSAGRGGAGGDRWTAVPVLAVHTCRQRGSRGRLLSGANCPTTAAADTHASVLRLAGLQPPDGHEGSGSLALGRPRRRAGSGQGSSWRSRFLRGTSCPAGIRSDGGSTDPP